MDFGLVQAIVMSRRVVKYDVHVERLSRNSKGCEILSSL